MNILNSSQTYSPFDRGIDMDTMVLNVQNVSYLGVYTVAIKWGLSFSL